VVALTAAAAHFRVPYTMQTGNSKFAPYATISPTKLTSTKTATLHQMILGDHCCHVPGAARG
jgi:hypothetical protein